MRGIERDRSLQAARAASTWEFGFLARARGIGAIEVHDRCSVLNFGHEVWMSGVADLDLWSKNAWVTDIGLNWNPSFYTKLYLDWQDSKFGNTVVISPGRFGTTRDLYWIRLQVLS
jgi:hypothetical protein